MLLAEDGPDRRIQAIPGAKGTCPICHAEVIPKCGEIKTWHWAHKSLEECDTWHEPEGDWHFNWKKLAGLENTEIVIRKPDGIHRADIKIDGLVTELQHSPLSPKEVRERESFYGSMIWVIDGESVGSFVVERWISKNDDYYLKWDGKPKAWINEIKRTKYYHFKRLAIYTYYWQNYYSVGYYSRYPQTEIPVSCKPIKRWQKKQALDYPIILEDVLVRPDKEFCKVIPKAEFVKMYFPAEKPKSLFEF